ncbi:MAG TPA: hypothetical protein VIS49_00995 [Cyclobacteriaceae bacterium]
MKRIPLIITLIIIILAGGLLWFYQFYNSEKVTAWDLIGSDAAIVIEFNSSTAFKEKLDQVSMVGKLVKSNNAIEGIVRRSSLLGKKYIISIHPISIDDFGIVVYTGLRGSENENTFLSPQQNESSIKRTYNGIKITELQRMGNIFLSYATIDDITLISNSSFLLEGALRLKGAKGDELFKNSNSALYRLPTLKSDEGNVYFNISNVETVLKLFMQPEKSKNFISLMGSGLADLRLNENGVLMNGFVEEADSSLLSLFENQEPQPIDFNQLVSNNVSALLHFGFSNTEKWFDGQLVYSISRNKRSIDSLENELKRLSVDIESLRKSIGNQLATCYLGNDGGKVIILKLRDDVGAVSVFDELSTKVSTEKRDSLYIENYAGYQIKLIDYENLLYQLFYPLSEPSLQSYFVRIGSFLILSESVERIKSFIDDIDNENTWGKSVEWSKFFSTSLQESNISVFFDGKLTSVYLRDKFNARWRRFFDSTLFLGIDKGAIQLSRLETNFYLNTSLQFSNAEVKPDESLLEKVTYDFGNEITRSPAIVRSHLSKEIEIVIQDSVGNLYLLSKDLKTQWKTSIDASIIDRIEQIDYFTNNKLQYLFVTERAIHLVDRLGRNVEGFPVLLKVGGLEFVSVVDYDRSKRYRYLMADTKGNLTLTDKTGVALEGWSPRVLGGRLINTARHYRILGKDYFIAIQQNGMANLLNRRGEMAESYPLDLGVRPAGDFFLTLKSNLSTTYFTVVSNDGMKIEFGLDGQIKKREALIKRTGATKFSLIKSKDGESFLFFRVDPGKLAILDPDGKIFFEFENPGSTVWELSYLENRLKERFYCLYDKYQNFSYLYDDRGQLLLSQPIDSTQPPALYFDENSKSLVVYNVFNSRVSQISIKY